VLPFAGLHPRWISAGPTNHASSRARGQSAPVTRAPEAHGERARDIVTPRACDSPRRLDSRHAPSTRVEHQGEHRPDAQAVTRWLTMWQHIAQSTQPALQWEPAGSGANAPLAREDRRLVGCVRASFQVAEVDESGRGPEKRIPRATGCVNGDLTPPVSNEPAAGEKA
jgi:hypothetical protein